ncbi:hypothetical protein RD792_007415 [Penstemon davidsonii]|uniref:Uncharacterized protein n=1 Tax=Penstemon davidsonii TaxID=160366 RepID=A0ABR0D6I8_9LAMI|nr:hypothetical protein RD792_007415 [Penstemon davidsonii]
MLMTSNAETEPRHEMHPQGGTENTLEPEPPETTIHGDDKAIPEVKAKAKAMYKYKRGAWSKDEDEKLRRAVEKHGVQNWIEIEKISGLARPAKNCRLRWFNYLRPNLKRYPFTQDEERKIILLHSKYGNSWSRIASKVYPHPIQSNLYNCSFLAPNLKFKYLLIYLFKQLPGRSDNEIKNFWHKRTKRRVPIEPKRKEESDQNSKYAPSSSSYENHSSDYRLPSSSIHSQEFKPSELNEAKTPTSRLHKLLLYPHQMSQSCQITETPCQSSNAFTFHRNPPILSSPKSGFRRFGKAESQLSPPSHSVSGSATSLQRQSSLAIESPKSPLKLKLTPGVPAVYSVQMMTPTINSPVSLQSNLSFIDSKVKLNTSTASASVSSSQVNPPIKPMPLDTDNAVPVVDSSFTFKTELSPIQCRVNNSSHKVETDSDLEILDALREAQTRVRFLKKKLRLSNKRNLMNKSSRKENFLVQSPENTDSIGRNSSQRTTKEYSSWSSLRVNAQCKNSRTEDLMKKISKNGVLLVKNASNRKILYKLQKRENSESENYSQDESTETDELIHGEISGARTLLTESSSEKESITYQEQRHSIDRS